IRGVEAHVLHRLHEGGRRAFQAQRTAARCREALGDLLDMDHLAASSSTGRNGGGRGTCFAQPVSTASAAAASAASMKRNSVSRMQPRLITPWPALGTTTWRALAPSARAVRLPWRGGVTGSSPPLNSS